MIAPMPWSSLSNDWTLCMYADYFLQTHSDLFRLNKNQTGKSSWNLFIKMCFNVTEKRAGKETKIPQLRTDVFVYLSKVRLKSRVA